MASGGTIRLSGEQHISPGDRLIDRLLRDMPCEPGWTRRSPEFGEWWPGDYSMQLRCIASGEFAGQVYSQVELRTPVFRGIRTPAYAESLVRPLRVFGTLSSVVVNPSEATIDLRTSIFTAWDHHEIPYQLLGMAMILQIPERQRLAMMLAPRTGGEVVRSHPPGEPVRTEPDPQSELWRQLDVLADPAPPIDPLEVVEFLASRTFPSLQAALDGGVPVAWFPWGPAAPGDRKVPTSQLQVHLDIRHPVGIRGHLLVLDPPDIVRESATSLQRRDIGLRQPVHTCGGWHEAQFGSDSDHPQLSCFIPASLGIDGVREMAHMMGVRSILLGGRSGG